MGGIVPLNEISIEDLKAQREMVANALLEMVSHKSGKSRSELVVRDILPLTDLGFATEEWDNTIQLTANDWTKDFSHELDEDQGIVFFGIDIQDEISDVLFVRFKIGAVGSTTKALYCVQRILKSGQEESSKPQKGFFSPVYFGGKETIYVDYYVRATVAAAAGHIVLIGLFCEPRGEVIS